MTEGVARTGWCGTPFEVMQSEVTAKSGILAAKGTVKAALLNDCGPLALSPLVVVSVYNTKSMHSPPLYIL
jgi:hypothetical protein